MKKIIGWLNPFLDPDPFPYNGFSGRSPTCGHRNDIMDVNIYGPGVGWYQDSPCFTADL